MASRWLVCMLLAAAPAMTAERTRPQPATPAEETSAPGAPVDGALAGPDAVFRVFAEGSSLYLDASFDGGASYCGPMLWTSAASEIERPRVLADLDESAGAVRVRVLYGLGGEPFLAEAALPASGSADELCAAFRSWTAPASRPFVFDGETLARSPRSEAWLRPRRAWASAPAPHATAPAAGGAPGATGPADSPAPPAPAAGTYLETRPLASQDLEQPAGTSLRLTSEVTVLDPPPPAAGGSNGAVAVAQDDKDIVSSSIQQAGSQVHLRVSRGEPDDRGAEHFLIAPYNFGMSLEYPGTVESWTHEWSVHTHPTQFPGLGGFFWVGNQTDTGGLFATARSGPTSQESWAAISADNYAHLSGGSLHFNLRNDDDEFRFQWGPIFNEEPFVTIGQDGISTELAIRHGSLLGVLAVGGRPGLRISSQGGVEIDTGGLVPTASFRPGGVLELGPSPASSGSLRLSPGASVTSKSPQGDGDVTLLATDGEGRTVLHDGALLLDESGLRPGADLGVSLGGPENRFAAVRAERVEADAAMVGGFREVAFSSHVVFDAARANTLKLTLTGDVAGSELVGAVAGQALTVIVCQDGRGGHGFEWPASVRGGMKIWPQGSACHAQTFVSDGETVYATSTGVRQ